MVVFYYDNDDTTAAADSYTIALTISAGTGCADRDDCANFTGRGECTGGLCVAFEGAGAQGAGEFCDSADDCSPATGSDWSSSPCFLADRNLGTDNVCVIDCTQESDCTTYGMHCYLVDATNTPPGICLAPCTSDAGCGGGVCNTGTGVCENAPSP